MTVFLIDGYNVLHQLIGHTQLPAGKHFRGAPVQGADSRLPAAETDKDGTDSPFGPGATDLEDSRNRLVDRIASYMGRTSDRAIIVFDSHSQMLQKQESATRNVEVYFGSFSHSADSIIEREAFSLSAGKNVVVVSSDYSLQKTIFRPNVIRRSSRQFVADLQEETRRIAITPNCTTMSHRIEDRVNPETIDKLKALRDVLNEKADEKGGG